jgi:hypothetical protein
MHPRLLPGMWHADLCHTTRSEPVRLSTGTQRDRPARTIWATVAANLVRFGAALVDGFASGPEIRPPMTAVRDWRGLPEAFAGFRAQSAANTRGVGGVATYRLICCTDAGDLCQFGRSLATFEQPPTDDSKESVKGEPVHFA